MRILIVTASQPRGPAEPFVLPELAELKRLGHELLIVPANPRGPVIHEDARALLDSCIVRPLFDLGIALTALGMLLRHPVSCVRALAVLAKSRNGRIALKNLAMVPKGLWLGAIARRHRVDHLHAYWLSTSATLAMVAASLADRPWSCTGYRWDIAEDNLLAEKARRAKFVRVADRAGAEEARSLMGAGVPGPIVIHSGVDLPKLETAARERPAGPLRLLMPANFVDKKGHRYMIEALVELNRRGVEVRCDFAGGGPLEASVRDTVIASDLAKNVRFPGLLPHRTFQQSLERGDWDVVVMPSIVTSDGDKEGIPASLIEAMARRIPVISTTTGGIPELLGDGAGVLIPPADSGALADAIAMFAASSEQLEHYAQRGRERAEESYDTAVVVQQLLTEMGAPQLSAVSPPSSGAPLP